MVECKREAAQPNAPSGVEKMATRMMQTPYDIYYNDQSA